MHTLCWYSNKAAYAHFVLIKLHAHFVLIKLHAHFMLIKLHAHFMLLKLHAHSMLIKLHAHFVLVKLHANPCADKAMCMQTLVLIKYMHILSWHIKRHRPPCPNSTCILVINVHAYKATCTPSLCKIVMGGKWTADCRLFSSMRSCVSSWTLSATAWVNVHRCRFYT